MHFRNIFILCLVCLWGCSDFGTGSDAGWTQYDLQYGHISLPAEMVRRQSVAALPENPEFVGIVGNLSLKVQFCIYTPLSKWGFLSYEEETTTLHNRKAVLFRGMGLFHAYDSHFSTLIGVKAYFSPGNDPVVVMIAILDPKAEDLARAILLTLHP